VELRECKPAEGAEFYIEFKATANAETAESPIFFLSSFAAHAVHYRHLPNQPGPLISSSAFKTSKMVFKTIKTPCIGVCSTSIGDSVCRGCKRFVHEIIGWNGFNDEQKRLVDCRLELFLTQIVQTRFSLLDEALLKRQIAIQQVRVLEHRNSWCQLFEFVKAGASQIRDPAMYGFEILPNHRHTSLVRLCHDVDEEFWTLSYAHFERYFRTPAVAPKADPLHVISDSAPEHPC